jgi:hypothetical protein
MNPTKVSKDYMKNTKGDRFDERLTTAHQAKQKRLEQFKLAADDPEKLAKRAQRQAVASVREEQRKADAAKLLREKEDLERQQAEDAAQETARQVELEAERAGAAEQEIMQEAAREAEHKAERDRRYAARRNRNR